MTRVQKIQMQQSTIKSQIAAELDKSEEERDHGLLDSLSKQAQNVEVELRAALVSDDEGLPADVETPRDEDEKMLELRSRVDFGAYVRAAVAGRGIHNGAEHELNSELGLEENQFPLDLFATGEVETRAKRDGDARANQQTWIDRVFASTAASGLGITFRSVNPGVLAIPMTTVGGSPVQRGREEEVGESTYTVTVQDIKPSRASLHGIYTMEDNARLPGLSDAILRDMRMGMTEGIDRKIFVGDAGANENAADIVGLNTAAIEEVEITQANKVTGTGWLSLFSEMIDGIYAADMSDLACVKSVGTKRLWLSTIVNAAAENQTLSAFLMANGIGGMTREGIDTATAAADFAGYVGLRRGQMGTAVAAVWNAGELIVDRYTKAKAGERVLTLHYLWQFKVIRPANYKRLKYVA